MSSPALAAAIVIMLAVIGNAQINMPAQHYCGRTLTSMLSLVCEGIYNGKRIVLNDIGAWSRDRREAVSMVQYRQQKRYRQRTPGIAEECCRKSCTIDEIRGYCGTTSTAAPEY